MWFPGLSMFCAHTDFGIFQQRRQQKKQHPKLTISPILAALNSLLLPAFNLAALATDLSKCFLPANHAPLLNTAFGGACADFESLRMVACMLRSARAL
jgi:hypothetical protein